MPEVAKSRPATIYDVAARAGVSHQTVSRVIKGHTVSEHSRRVVERAIDALEFTPNRVAQALATRRSRRIGAFTYELDQFGPLSVLTGASAAARAAGYVIDIVSVDPFDDASVREGVALVNQRDIAGVLAFAPSDSVRARLAKTDFRVPVYFENELDESPHASAQNINRLTGELAADHLLRFKHRFLAQITGPLTWSAARMRSQGFSDRVAEQGHALTYMHNGNWSAESGFRGAQLILRHAPETTAIFASNDQMAVGAMAAISQHGLRIPQDISVIGVDDTPESPYTIPPLTSIPMLFTQQGQHSFYALQALIEGGDVEVPPPPMDIAVITRASTGPPPVR